MQHISCMANITAIKTLDRSGELDVASLHGPRRRRKMARRHRPMRGLIIGSGVVGSATGKGFQAGGMDVTFYDVNPARVKELSSQGLQVWDGTSPIQPEIIFVCVGTPSVRGGLDLTYLRSATKTL